MKQPVSLYSQLGKRGNGGRDSQLEFSFCIQVCLEALLLVNPDSDTSTPSAIRKSKHKVCMCLSRDFEGERFGMAWELKW